MVRLSKAVEYRSVYTFHVVLSVIISAFIVERVNYHWILYLGMILALFTAGACSVLIPKVTSSRAHMSQRERIKHLDLPGVTTFTGQFNPSFLHGYCVCANTQSLCCSFLDLVHLRRYQRVRCRMGYCSRACPAHCIHPHDDWLFPLGEASS